MKRITFIFSTITTAFFLGIFFTPTAQAVPPCIDGDTKWDGTSCPAGNVCNAGDQCNPFDLIASGTIVGATAINTQVQTNADVNHTITLFSCLGVPTSCGTPPNANWRNEGTNSVFSVTYLNLRPGRTYTLSFYSTFEGAIGQTSVSATTWPFPSFTPTVSGIGDTSATINWTTSFNGSTRVYYRPASPDWSSDTNPSPIVQLTAVTATSAGKAWAAGGSGRIFYNSPGTGTWTSQASAGAYFLKTIDALDDQNVWAGGDNGNILHTTNGGATWGATPSGTTGNVISISAGYQNTAWAATESGQILYYNGVNWQVKYTNGSISFNSITSLDGKEIWAVGSNSSLVTSRNAGTTWTVVTLPLASAGESIATLNGQTLWIGGSNGELLRSTNRGTSWQTIASGTTSLIRDISLISDTEFWFTTQLSVGRYNAAAAPAVTTFTTDPNTVMSSPVFGITTINGTEVIAVGQLSEVARYGVNRSSNIFSSGTSSTTHSANLTGLASNTQYYFAAVSIDPSGIIGSGTLGTFFTTAPDTVPPVISITTPATTPLYTNQASISVSGSASDNIGVQTISLSTVNASGTTTTATTNLPALPNAGPVAWTSAPAVSLQPGTNTITVQACDGSANCSTDSTVVIFDNQVPTVTITAPTNGSTVNTSTITVSGTSSDNDQVVSGQYQLNGGALQNFTLTPGQTPPWTFSLTGLTLGSNTLQVFVRDRAGNTSAPATVTFNYFAPTFDVTIAPATQTISAGQSASYTVTVTPLNGFTGPVNLTLSGNPAGSTVTFVPNPVTVAGGPVTAAMSVLTASTPTGTFTLTVTGTGGSVTDSATAQLVIVTPPDFSLSSTPGSRTVVAGASTTYSITATANTTYTGTVSNMTLTDSPTGPLPAGVTATFTPPTVTLANNQSLSMIMNVTTTAATPSGTFNLRVSGTDTAKGITRFVDITLVINLPPDVSLTVLPATQTITAGAGVIANYNGKAIALNGYNRPSVVTASVGSTIAGMTITVTPNSFVPAVGPAGTDFVLSIAADSRVPGATYTVTVTLTADDNSLTKTVQVQLVVTGDTTPPIISITQPDVTPNYDRVTVAWRTNELANSRVEVYSDASRSAASLVGIMSDPAYVTTRSLVYVGLNPLTTYYLKVISADQAPTPNSASTILYDDGSPLLFTTLDTPDFSPPTITIDQPTTGQTVSGSISITGVATDNKAVSTITVTIVRPNGTTAYVQTLNPGVPSYNYVVNWDSLDPVTGRVNGLYTFKARATDASGNLSPEVTIAVNVQNDLTAPVVAANYPEAINLVCNATTNKCQITIHWFTDDASTSKVEYAREDTYFASGYALTADYDDADGNTTPSVPVYREHTVTIQNLDKNFLYHYKITSCNISNFCTN